MRVSIDCDQDSSQWYLRQFAIPLVPESFQAPETMLNLIDVPEYVVAAYCALQIQTRTMECLLSTLFEQHEEQQFPDPPPFTGTGRQD